ncbi:hypothetical protein FOIG_08258 [Fusarium odoratissimum NRRL 54006]|nr:uncharacterized protein FOIG_08258 [Fusarium odoratissimum NRRL 54006]EXM00275.1 hypothetical protein FOIG_08258 [Fusarium odoratissimum NRRL 54006]
MSEFKSNYGPKYHPQPNVAGITPQSAFRIGSRLAMYGAPAAVAVLLFANGIPRVQRDVLQKIPFLGNYFRKEIHPADNVSLDYDTKHWGRLLIVCIAFLSYLVDLRKIDVVQRPCRLSLYKIFQ